METKNPALVILIPGFPSDEDDSVCLPAQQSFVLALNKNFPGTPIIILAFQYPFFNKTYHWFGNKVIAFGGKNKGGFSRLLLWRRIRSSFAALKKETEIMGILSFWCGECALMAKRLSAAHDIPYLIWIMGQDAGKQNKYVLRINPSPFSLVAISDFTRNEFTRNHSVRPEYVVPLGNTTIALEETERNIDLLGVGSLIPLKQFDLFIKLVLDVKNIYPKIKAVLIGKGPEEKRLKELITKNELQDNISLTGELEHQQVLGYMSCSRILLHPSSTEGFSGVCLEAISAGAHVISFCKPMEQEIPHWHTVNSVDEMRDKLLNLLENKLDHNAVNAYPINITTRTIVELFEGSDPVL